MLLSDNLSAQFEFSSHLPGPPEGGVDLMACRSLDPSRPAGFPEAEFEVPHDGNASARVPVRQGQSTRNQRGRFFSVALPLGLFAVLIATPWLPVVADGRPGDSEASEEKRAPWLTSKISGSPEPPHPWITERAFPGLTFTNCLDIGAIPGSDRLFVVEQAGRVLSFPGDAAVQQADLMIDFAQAIPGVQQVYALTFHPDFTKNRYCYVCYILDSNRDDGTHVARFQVTDTVPPTIDVATETTLVTWWSGGHNGCCLRFGPDGCLYISTGDGGAPNPPDPLKAGQDLSNLLSAILRIDVDHADEGRNYRIPADNPFVDLPGVRGEIWAYGLRNPWRMSFDGRTGDLWVGDVGWEMWEMLYRVERGGNFGWAITEGRQSINPEWTRGPTPILPPTIDHPHTESSSITDGLTYYGESFPELQGTHLYGDYDTGKIWGFRYENGTVVQHTELADTTHRIVAFGTDQRGEFYLLDHPAGTIHRMIPNPQKGRAGTFPRRLSDSGLFSSVKNHEPASGVLPYSISAEPWADHAVAERLVAVPGDGSIRPEGAVWAFPENSVLVKTLSLEMQQGNPASRRRVETQILHFDGVEWQPYTYQWNEDQSDAVLLDAAGSEQIFEITDPSAAGGTRRQVWRFAGRAECARCHNKWSGPPLAFNTPQLNRRHTGGGGSPVEQLSHLAKIGLLASELPLAEQPHLASPQDLTAELDARARAYLQVNCAHCHRMHAGGAVLSQMHYDLPLDKTNMIGVRPTQGTFGIHSAHVISAGDPFRSVLLYRMAKLGGGRMPHIGSAEVDRAGIALIHDWIRQIPAGNEDDAVGSSAKSLLDEAAELQPLRSARLPDEAAEHIDRLLSSSGSALMLLCAVSRGELPPATRTLIVDKAAGHADTAIRDLFEQFLPPEARVQRLGSVIRPEQILALSGDPARGRSLFFDTAGVSCRNCHRVHQEGKEIGPDLTTIGKKLSPVQLLESILDPSRLVEPKYVTYLAETRDGRLQTGLLVTRDETEVVLRNAQDQLLRIPLGEIEQLVPQRQSLMPELLLRDLTAQQVADLLAWLSSLR